MFGRYWGNTDVCSWRFVLERLAARSGWIADSPVFKSMPAKRTPWKSSEARRQIGQLRNRIHVSTGARLRGGD